MTIIKGEFQPTGVNEIDTDLVVENWSHLWCLTEWRRDNTWTVIKFLSKGSVVLTKTAISRDQAYELIERLDLKPVDSFFNSSRYWINHMVEPNDMVI